MLLADFDYELPEELIARFPPARRRDSRLLVVGESPADHEFTDLPALLRRGDLLVLNDTRVIPARLEGRKSTGGKVEVLVERVVAECRVLAQQGFEVEPNHVRASQDVVQSTTGR